MVEIFKRLLSGAQGDAMFDSGGAAAGTAIPGAGGMLADAVE